LAQSSSYVEGRCCPLAKLGYSRDAVKGKLQVNYGLTCSPEGRPVAICMHDGNTQDQKTLPDAVAAVTERFQSEHVVVVGDRGMLTQAHAQTLKQQGIDFISALKGPQVRALVNSGELQLSLFDEHHLAEITSAQFPDQRLVVCRNPAVAAERARKRESMLQATETELQKVKAMVDGQRGRLRDAEAGKIGERAGKTSNPLLFDDETPLAPTDPVKQAKRSPAANTKAGSHHTTHGHPAHTLPDLLADLGTLCRNHLRIGHSEHTFTRLTTLAELQATALQLAGVKLTK